MDAATRQKQLDEISDEDLERIKAHQASTSGRQPVDDEWLLLTEFAISFGWQAYLDAKNDAVDDNGNLKVTFQEMLTLIEASRRLRSKHLFQNAQTTFMGVASANSTKPSNTLKSITKDLVKDMKADEL